MSQWIYLRNIKHWSCFCEKKKIRTLIEKAPIFQLHCEVLFQWHMVMSVYFDKDVYDNKMECLQAKLPRQRKCLSNVNAVRCMSQILYICLYARINSPSKTLGLFPVLKLKGKILFIQKSALLLYINQCL